MKIKIALGVACVLHFVSVLAIPLPDTLDEARALERANALPSTSLYTKAYDLYGSKPGNLLAQEAFGGYVVPGLARAVRIAYHSEDVLGRATVTTAMILLPAGRTPAGGWPIIAWGHGTSGVSTDCAPSLMRDGYYGDEGLSDMLKAGFAIVATDYQGLGTPGAHLYVDKPSQARDLIYSVPAARSAVPELGKRWVADGHSQGGLASWGVAELEEVRVDDGYLGAISVSGAGSLEGLFAYILEHPKMTFYLPWMAAGIHARFPEFKPESILAPAIMRQFHAAISHGCWYSGYAMFKDTPKNTAFKPGWRNDPTVRRWIKENELGDVKISKPLLVISGEDDQTVPIAGVRSTVRNSCAAGSNLYFMTYPGLDHDETMMNSVQAQIGWMRDRFAGKAFSGTCVEQSAGRGIDSSQ